MKFNDVMVANDAEIERREKRKELNKVLFWNKDESDTYYLTYFMTMKQIEELAELCDRLGFPLNYTFVTNDEDTPIWGE